MKNRNNIAAPASFPLFILMGDAFGIEMFNEALLARMGKTREEVLHKPYFEVFPEACQCGIENIFRTVYQTGRRYVAEHFPVPCPGGRAVEEREDYKVVHYPIKDEKGTVTGIIAVGQTENGNGKHEEMVLVPASTLTKQKATGQKAGESVERFRAVFENASVGIAITSLEGCFLEVNEAYERITGYTAEELKQTTFKALTHPFDRERNMQQVADLLEGKTPCFTAEKRYLRKDGGTVWMKLSVSLIRDEHGNPQNILAVAENVSKAKEVREKLALSEERFRTMANSISQLAWMTDEKGAMNWFNQRWYDYTGTTPEEMHGWGWINVLHPALRQEVPERLKAALKAGKAWEDTLLLRSREGEYRWFLSRAQPVHRPDGQLTGWFGTNTDITDQRRIEEDLQEKTDQLQTALEVGELGYFDFFPKTGELKWSDRSKQLFGIPLEMEANDQTFIKTLHPEDLEQARAALEYAMRPESGGHYLNEYRIFGLNDGKMRWVRSKGRVFFDKEGKPERFAGVNQEITEQKLAEEKLKESEQRFRHLADQTPIWIFICDENIQITYANREELHYLGLTHYSELNPGVWEQYIHPEDIDEVLTAIQQASISYEPWTREARILNVATNEYEWFQMKGVPRIEKADFVGFIGTAVNIHQQKMLTEKLEELVANRTRELQRSNEDLQQFAHVASHDLKEPVRKIKTYTNFLQEVLLNRMNEKEKAHLSKVQSAADRMLVMIDGVLTYSTINALEQMYTCVDLNEVLKNIETDLEVAIQQKGALIRYGRLPRIDGAPVLLYQLFYNLINNSLKFAKAGTPPVISITSKVVRREGKTWTQLNVMDNGIGFEQKYAEKIFGTFTRLNAKDKFEGTGLGLSLCKKIVERHGGCISARARENEGATFEILLPIATGAAKAADSHSAFR